MALVEIDKKNNVGNPLFVNCALLVNYYYEKLSILLFSHLPFFEKVFYNFRCNLFKSKMSTIGLFTIPKKERHFFGLQFKKTKHLSLDISSAKRIKNSHIEQLCVFFLLRSL